MINTGTDLDGTTRDNASRLIKVYKKHHPNHEVAPISLWDNYNVSQYFPIGQEIYKFWFEDHAEEIYSSIEFYPGAREFISELNRITNLFYVTTQPNELTKQLTLDWIVKLGLDKEKALFLEDKSLFDGEFLLDDYTKNLENLAKKGETRTNVAKPICFNRPWNQDWKGKRVYSYKEFLDLARNHH